MPSTLEIIDSNTRLIDEDRTENISPRSGVDAGDILWECVFIL